MAINVLQLFGEARNTYGFQGTFAQVQSTLADVEQQYRQQWTDAERSRYSYVIWDEVSPIAGQSAEYWRQQWAGRGEWPEGGKVYIIYIDGFPRIVQPFDPKSMGYVAMDEQTALARAEAYVSALVEQAVDEKVKEQVLINLLTQ